MAENKNDNKKKESIQQQPDHVDDQKKQPVTPEPPKRKIRVRKLLQILKRKNSS